MPQLSYEVPPSLSRSGGERWCVAHAKALPGLGTQKAGVFSPAAEQGFNDVGVVNGVKDNQEFLHEQYDFFYNREALTRKTVVVNGVTRV